MTDPFAHDDAAYVLGVLSPAEHAAFEAHLHGCADCTARVAEIADLPRLLVGVRAEDLEDPPGTLTPAVAAADAVPDTLLPALLRRARADRRRGRAFALAGALAAACIAAVLAIVLSGSPAAAPARPPVAAGRAMQPLLTTPVRARVALTGEQWGTRITLHCRYTEPEGGAYQYGMAVVDRAGHRYVLGSWRIRGGQHITYVAGAPIAPRQIAAVVVTLPDGSPVLRLRT